MLSEIQKKVVEFFDKSLCIIAGPGCGKTNTITQKIKYLHLEKKVSLDEVLAITFTKKASNEMENRVFELINKNFKTYTFHSFALSLIEEFSSYFSNFDKNYKIIDEEFCELFFLENIENGNLKLNSVEIKNNLNSISSDLAKTIFKLKEHKIKVSDLEKLDIEINKKIDLINFYSKYEKFKKDNNLIDYCDILIYLDLALKNDEFKEKVREKYKYILVDEYQDSNKIQFEILKNICSENKKNVCVVCDLKQSIYGFRASTTKQVENFLQEFSPQKIYLNENYRFSQKINEVSNEMILKITDDKNEILKKKSNVEDEGNFEIFDCLNENSQFNFLIEKIFEIKNNSKKKDISIGIICRTKKHINSIKKYFNFVKVFNKRDFEERIFENNIVKEILLYLKVIDNYENQIEVFELLNVLDVKKSTIKKLCSQINSSKNIFEVLKKHSLNDFKDFLEESEIIKNFSNNIIDLYNLKKLNPKLSRLIFEIIDRNKYYKNLLHFDENDKIQILNSFVNFTKEFEDIYKTNSIEKFLKICDICKYKNVSKKDENLTFIFSSKSINLSIEILTSHSSKGKEFDYVFIPYLNQKHFPTNKKTSLFELNIFQDENSRILEEKRLFFVSITRAKIGCFISFVKKFESNKLDSKKSCFIDEFFSNHKIKIYDKDEIYNNIKLSKKDKIKNEIIKNISKNLIDKNFDLANEEFELYKKLFLKSQNKDNNLLHFENKNPKEKYYRNLLENLEKDTDLFEIIDYDFSKKVYSYSQISTYKSCPKKYLFQNIYKIPQKERHYFSFGTAIHSVLEELVKDKIFEKFCDDFEKIFIIGISKLKTIWPSGKFETLKEEEEYFEMATSMIKNFIEKEINFFKNNQSSIALELNFPQNILIQNKRITGFIDRIDKKDNDYFIYDYKTSKKMELQKDIDNSDQLYLYAFAFKEIYGNYPKKMGLWYLKFNKIMETNFNLEILENKKKEIGEIILEIEKKNFKAKPSFLCKWCDYKNICKDSFTNR